MTSSLFRKIVLAYYKKSGRHDLPWRNLPAGRQGRTDVYKILVSEVMLQQTQVERVLPFYKNFIKQFGTAKKLADAPLAEVLKSWQGLGYNRRAKMLHSAAKELTSMGKFNFPMLVAELEKLPGVGPYTARAVAAFAWNQDVVVIETNIRTAVIHHFFSKRSDVEDTELVEVLKKALPKGRAREWYNALMDYGAHLKRSGISHNIRSKIYIKQSKFTGSLREARGAILRELSKGSVSRVRLMDSLGRERKEQLVQATTALLKEGLIEMKKNKYALAR